jgi:hypothetical protein
MPNSGAEKTRAWRKRKRTSEVTVQNVKRKRASEVTVQNVKKEKIDLKLNETVEKGVEYVLVWTV